MALSMVIVDRHHAHRDMKLAAERNSFADALHMQQHARHIASEAANVTLELRVAGGPPSNKAVVLHASTAGVGTWQPAETL